MQTVAADSEHWSEIQDWILGEQSQVLAFSGRLKQARAMSRRAVELALQANRREAAAQHEAAAAVREALFGNAVEARRQAVAAQKLSHGKDAQYGSALAFAFAGDSIRAHALTADLEQRYPEDTIVRFNFLPTLRAISAMQHGHADQAIEMLGKAARYEMGWLGCCSVGFVGSLYPIYVRGEAYLAMHKGPEAVAEFQKILKYRGLAGSNPIGVLAYWRLGKAFRIAGNIRGANAEYDRFLSLWRSADSDVPVLRHVKAERETF